jgi:hypothetical protein
MSSDEPTGVVFPSGADGRRSTSALGRAVVADALRRVDAAAARDAEREHDWRRGYPRHFRRLIEAGLASRQDAITVARDGLESLYRRMRVAGPGGEETGLDALTSEPARRVPDTVTVAGSGGAEQELAVPYRGERLSGDALLRRLEAWVAAGVIEPSCAAAVQTVAANPGWLSVPGRTVAVLGAGAELSPLPVLLGWGARVAAVDLPIPAIWDRALDLARHGGGTLLIPVADHQHPEQDPDHQGHQGQGHQGRGHQDEGHQGQGHQGRGHQDEGHQGQGHQGQGHQGQGHEGQGHQGQGHQGQAHPDEADPYQADPYQDDRDQADQDLQVLVRRAGLDLIRDVSAAADWLAGIDGPLVLGNYVYADGAANVRVATAVDALTVRLQAGRRDVALAFLATPTDVFAVPADAVAQSASAYAARSPAAKMGGWPLRALSGGRLLRRAYPPGADPGVCDSLIPQQGPNYALAKRLQRWRATLARDEGATVSMNVAPPTRTRSVTKNRVLAAAYAGSHRFGVEVFEPATCRTLMAALLVHDLHTGGGPAHPHPWQDEARAAAHGGLWRIAYAPRSALTLATLLGYPASRKS